MEFISIKHGDEPRWVFERIWLYEGIHYNGHVLSLAKSNGSPTTAEMNHVFLQGFEGSSWPLRK